MVSRNQPTKAESQSVEPIDSSLLGSLTHPDRYIYQKNIAISDSLVGDRYIVTVERQFASHWTVREVDAPADRVPQLFTVIPHKDLIPWQSTDKKVLPEPEVRVDINSCTTPDLIKAMPGIGVAAHYIVERRPKTGYPSLAYVKQLNADLPIDWVGFNSRVSFTPVGSSN